MTWGRLTPPPPSASRGWRNTPANAGLRWGLEISLTFLTHSLGMLYQIFEFLLCAEAPPGPLSRGHVCQVSDNFFLQIFGNCKNLIVCDGLVYWETCPEICPKSFKKQRSYDDFKHLVKNGECYFWPPETQIFGFFGFSKTDLVVHDERNRMAFTPSKSALRFSRSQGGAESAPLTS